ncbi:GGDEF domain-containing protein [Luteimonas sp. S4-F44]|uniref:GGDEF domain-containing protein n=1 Tax=Luteimonas sp. S4-F44 TaxID=2925842 RepID=UPI001F53C7BD|nr:diguanylate cyclase [Luteimonas sp. S4-F44]UNK42746.1 GGDEF domain-containing protein [Luteimonas sp. S4-F44]
MVARWAAAALLWACATVAYAQGWTLQRLDDPTASADAPPADTAGPLRPNRPDMLFERERGGVWWKLTSRVAFPADEAPKLLVYTPFLNQIEAWPPGADTPSRHGVYGAYADHRYSPRALVIDLPDGLRAGQTVWLRVIANGSIPMHVDIAPLAQVQREDLRYAYRRAFSLGATTVLLLLAAAFWLRLRERAHLYFAANLICVLTYLLVLGGEARDIPLLEATFGSSLQPQRVLAALGGLFAILFQARYLDVDRHLPRIAIVLRICAAVMAAIACGHALFDSRLLSYLGNLGLMVSSVILLLVAWVQAWRGQREARILSIAWLPLLGFCILRTLELMGAWNAPAWVGSGMDLGLATSGLLLTLGLADAMVEMRRDRDRASRLAMIDGLTGLSSRNAIEQRLAQEIAQADARATPLSVAFIDLDRFKAINDRYGHALGDECLRIVAARARNRLRERDALGRYGGDELLAVLPGTPLAQAEATAQAICTAVRTHPLSAGEQTLPLSLSIGVAQFVPGESMADLLARADAALYVSKTSGRDRVSIAPPPASLPAAHTDAST